jgi:hypothetical protein
MIRLLGANFIGRNPAQTGFGKLITVYYSL